MKKFIIRSLIFLIPVIAFIAAWEYGLSTIQNSYMLKRAQLEARAPQIEVLVLGGSFSLRGVNPDYFCMKGYNAANVEQSLFYDTRITLKYLDKMTSLKVVLIAVSYNNLWGQTKNFRDYFYADYWGIRYPSVKWYNVSVYSRILQYGNGQAWVFALKGFKVNLVRGYFDNGWAISESKNGPINDSAGYALALRNEKKDRQEDLYSNINDIKRLLSELTRRKIHPVFFIPPEPRSLSEFINKSRLKTMDSVLSELCKTYHCEEFNYQNDPRFSDNDFRNISHLNQYGAVKFSKIINNEILEQYCSGDSINASLKK